MGRNRRKAVWDFPTISHTHEEISYDNLDNFRDS